MFFLGYSNWQTKTNDQVPNVNILYWLSDKKYIEILMKCVQICSLIDYTSLYIKWHMFCMKQHMNNQM